MAASVKRDDVKQKWEDSEFPLVCETCLGDNAYLRMTKEPHGKKCRICDTPFTLFAWQAGTKGRLKKVEICRNCAQSKNVCQVCIYDLQYGLPVKLRDKVLKEAGASSSATAVPMSYANRAWYSQQQQRLLDQGQNSVGDDKNAMAHAQLQSIARMEPRYERNLPKLCSFFARGECNRGSDCPFRHEMPRDRNDPLAKQNTKNRFFGTNDPVASKLWAKLIQKREAEGKLNAERKEDGYEKAKATLYLRFEGDEPYPPLTEVAIRDALYSFGEIVSVRMQPAKGQAFVEYTQPEATQWAISTMHRKALLGRKILVAWARTPKRGNPANNKSQNNVPIHHNSNKDGDSTSTARSTPAASSVSSSGASVEMRPALPPGASRKPLPKGLVAAKPPPTVAARQQQSSSFRSNVPRPGGGVIRGAGLHAAKTVVGSSKPYYPSADPSRLGTK